MSEYIDVLKQMDECTDIREVEKLWNKVKALASREEIDRVEFDFAKDHALNISDRMSHKVRIDELRIKLMLVNREADLLEETLIKEEAKYSKRYKAQND